MKNHKLIKRYYGGSYDEYLEVFIAELTKLAEGMIKPSIDLEYGEDLVVSGYVPMTEAELAAAEKKRKIAAERKRKQHEKEAAAKREREFKTYLKLKEKFEGSS